MIYTADYLLPVSSGPIERGQMLVRDGGIIAVGRDIAELYPNEQIKEFSGCAILPGFVNCHTHIELTGLRGRMDGLPFLDWLRALGAEGRAQSRRFFEDGARSACRELLAGGTTTIGDISSHGVSETAITESGIRAVIFAEIIAFRSDEQTLSAIRQVFDSLPENNPLITNSVSIHTLFTVSPKALDLAVALARERRLPLAVHVAESLAEGDFMHGRGPLAEYHREIGIDWEIPEVSPIRYLADTGVLNASAVAAHCINVSPEDLDILASTGAAVAHCPTSNARLGHGIAPARDIIEREIVVGLGTDSTVSSDRLDMFQEMRTAILFARARERDPAAISAAEVLNMATLGSANALGLGDRIGSLEPGKRADFIAVELASVDSKANKCSSFDPVSVVVFTCGPEHVCFIAVDGMAIATGH
jgi:cytosine/adenosine deaminase-related metal-dependent hydrolase